MQSTALPIKTSLSSFSLRTVPIAVGRPARGLLVFGESVDTALKCRAPVFLALRHGGVVFPINVGKVAAPLPLSFEAPDFSDRVVCASTERRSGRINRSSTSTRHGLINRPAGDVASVSLPVSEHREHNSGHDSRAKRG